MFKKLAATGVAVIAVVALTGCLEITDQQSSQVDVIGPLRLTTTLCTTNGSLGNAPADPSSCTPASSTSTSPFGGSGGREQLLLAYLVPTTITPPATIALTTVDGPQTMSPDFSYAAVVETANPAPAGEHWLGFRSALFDPRGSTPSATDPGVVAAAADFGLPPASDGGPFASGPVTYRVNFGERYPAAGNEDAPVQCYSTSTPPLTVAQRAKARRAIRRGARSVRSVAKAAGVIGPPDFSGDTDCNIATTDPITADTRDLAVLPGGGATATQGSTVTVPFNVKFAGPASPDATFALSASGVPGTSVAPSITPAGDSTTMVPVTVAVPADLAPGTYDVHLTATKGAQARTGTTRLTVTAAPPPLPPLTETLDELPQSTLASVTTTGQPATVGCNVNCAATVDLLMYKPPADRVGIAARRKWHAVPTVLLGRVKVDLSGGAKQTVTVAVKDSAKDKLHNLGKFTLLIRTTAVDSRGQRTPALVRKVRLKPGCAGRAGCVPRR
ncbi:MAG: COG1470 family protein [Solirubrobacteraceae bacterium]